MNIHKEIKKEAYGIEFIAKEGDERVGRVFLYILYNDLHEEPFAFMEDVFVEEKYRKKGLGTELVKTAIDQAKAEGCYKIICTSRYDRETVHKWYEKLGFKNYGYQFRINLK